MKEKIHQLLYSFDIGTENKKTRIRLQYQEGKDFIESLITNELYKGPITNSIKRMREAYNYLLTNLDNINECHLLKFISYLLLKVEMVVIIPENIHSALNIFETINQRGIGLNSMDLLKNLIFKVSDNNCFEKIKTIWKDIIKSLEACGEGDKPLRFLRYFLIAKYHDGLLSENEIYNYITSEKGKKKNSIQSNTLSFAEELRDDSSLYKDYVNATVSDQVDKKYPSLTNIGYIGKKNIRQHLILLLALHDNLKRNSEAVELLTKNIEVLIFYYTIIKVSTRNLDSKFSFYAKALRKVETIDQLKIFIETKFKSEIKESLFDEAFKNIRASDLRPRYRIKYFYGKIENYIRENSCLKVNTIDYYKDYHLEHIMPQTPNNQRIPEDFNNISDYQYYIEMLGNLTIIEPNINQALNKVNGVTAPKWFYGKLIEYNKSDIRLTKSISNIENIGADTSWNKFANNNLVPFHFCNKETIKLRQFMLMKIVKEIWKISM